jgi:hypothetical protein
MPSTVWERLSAPDSSRAEAACELTLLFHRGGPWLTEQCEEWDRLLSIVYAPDRPPSLEGTTKVLCDAIRYALDAC